MESTEVMEFGAKVKVYEARKQALIDLADCIISLKTAAQDLENVAYAIKQGRLDGLDYRIQDIIDDPSVSRIRDFANDPDVIDSMRTGLI